MDSIVKARPFKKVYCDRPEVFLLPPTAFKLWMYHYIREGQSRESWCSLMTISTALGMSDKTVKKARKFLLDNGWMKKTGTRNRSNGEFKVPIMMVMRGTIPPQGRKFPAVKVRTPRVKSSLWTEGRKFPLDRGKKVPSEVESELQLDSNSSQMPPSMPFSNSKPSPVAEGLGKIQVPQGKKLPTVEERRAQFEYMRTHGGDEAVWIKLKGEFDPEVTA